jgi:hypothetical protein
MEWSIEFDDAVSQVSCGNGNNLIDQGEQGGKPSAAQPGGV